MEGVAIIDPATTGINSLPSPVVIEECRLDGVRVACGEELHIEPGQVNLEIQYTANSFIKAEQVRFKYQLAGQDADWLEVGTRRTAYYSQVPPGKYIFTVRAANSDGVWNEQGPRLKIVVEPHWWQTWWFEALAVLGMIGAIAFVYWRRVTRLKREHGLREEFLERERAAQEGFSRQLIETQEQERARFASDLHDSLNQFLLVIKTRAQLAAEGASDPAAVRAQLKEIAELSAQSLDLSREIAHDLRPQQLDKLGLAAALEGMIEKVSAAAPIRFYTELADVRGRLAPEAEIGLFRIAQESVNNIIKHSQASAARLELAYDDLTVTLLIADNGQGFALATARSPRSFGLTNIAERARLLGGVLDIETAPGQGTTIKIVLKQ